MFVDVHHEKKQNESKHENEGADIACPPPDVRKANWGGLYRATGFLGAAHVAVDRRLPNGSALAARGQMVTTSFVAETPPRSFLMASGMASSPWPTTVAGGAARYAPLARAAGRKST